MFGWPVVVIVLFLSMHPRRAVIVGVLGAWMFLPMASYRLPGLPDITKMSTTCAGIVLGAMLVDMRPFMRLRWSWVDMFMMVWLLVPLASSTSAGYGLYEGISGAIDQTIWWGLPYLAGRLYFGNVDGLRELAVGIFIGGLLYTPLVLFEVRMSPQLHRWVYGFYQHEFYQSWRGDGWRPTVFMQHGLAVAMFMSTAAVCGLWLWWVGRLRVMRGMPVWILAFGLVCVSAACRSSYALILMILGIAVLVTSRYLRTRALLAAIILIAPAYIVARTVGGWDAGLLQTVSSAMGDGRQGSLGTRLHSEDICWHWLHGHEALGRGRFDGIQATVPTGDKFIPDGMWIIALAKNGLIGTAAMFGVLLLPFARLLSKFRTKELFSAEFAGALVMGTVLALYALDCLLNAMLNPIYLLAAGGLSGFMRPLAPSAPAPALDPRRSLASWSQG
jgi:hypothetical protein